ncbi:MAG: alpha-2-macroglobulin [Geminicoccaceae bacterium]|nr:alpha-2-macroglobulin [Geminicoccaceae bacterium]
MRRYFLARLFACALIAFVARAGAAAALEYLSYELAVEQRPPGVCLLFDRALPRLRQAELAPFVRIEPTAELALVARGTRLCASGLVHGERYRLTVEAGLPAADGARLDRSIAIAFSVPDRAPNLAFKSRGTLLPLRPGTGLPLESVNVRTARITLYRVSDRNLPAVLEEGVFGGALEAWSEERIAETLGERVGAVRVALPRRPNETVRTLVPLESLLPSPRPGLYVAVAVPEGAEPEPWENRATQWFTLSDLALSAVRGSHGLTLLARALEDARPLSGVRIELLARNNEVLATAATDERGLARIPAGRLRGSGGAAPRLLLARKGEGDLVLVRLDEPPLDLVELGIEGRTPPGPLDAFLWTERGVYRTGETVHLGVLVRDAEARAVPDLPVTVKLFRPDGLEAARFLLPADPLGGGRLSFPVASEAASGVWTLTAHAGADAPAIGSASFVVEDFVPPRLELALRPVEPRVDPTRANTVRVEGRYLFGAPAAELPGELEVVVRSAREPFPEAPGYVFGLVGDEPLPEALPASAFATDARGRAELAFELEQVPETSRPLEVLLRARLFDIDGRPVTAETTAPLSTGERWIGLRAAFGQTLGEGSAPLFDLLLLDRDGRPYGPAPLAYELFAEDWDYVWFQRGGRWEWQEVIHDRVIGSGEVAVAGDGRGRLELSPLPFGRYRLEVFDPAGGAATGLRFSVGWQVRTDAAERPDKLPLDVRPAERPGRMRVRIEPAFDARVALFLADHAVRAVHELEVPRGGAEHEIEVGTIGPGGAHLLAVAVSAAGAVLPRLPVRAVGVAWLPGPLAERRLDLALEAPKEIRPSSTLEVAVRLTGARDEPSRVVLALVDDAILALTRFSAPDPVAHYFGRRALGVELRDVYGRLVDPAGEIGRVESGGDRRIALQITDPNLRRRETVATMTSPLVPDPEGVVRARFPVPDFAGRLRLVAVAWGPSRVGAAETTVVVRPPLVAELALPRFLAPGDRARVRLDLLPAEDLPPGTWRARLATEGPVSLDRTSLEFPRLAADRRGSASLELAAGPAPGDATVRLALEGPKGIALERSYRLSVRSPRPALTRRRLEVLEPGQSLVLRPEIAAEFLPGTARLGLRLASLPAFDVPGLLSELEGYPYGCAEQVASRAFAFLAARRAGALDERERWSEIVQSAIGRLVSLETAAGGFAAWTASGPRELWLSAYVQDFLLAAKAAEVPVPETMLARTRDFLAARLAALGEGPADLAAGAYAAWVLAREGAADPSRLRWFALRAEQGLPTDAARIQLAAALASLGERALVARLLAALGEGRTAVADRLEDYGSPLRDDALVLAVAGEARLLGPERLFALADRAARRAAATRHLSTQEQAWLLRAAAALRSDRAISATLGAEALRGEGAVVRSAPAPREPVALRNTGRDRLWVSIALTGLPADAGRAESRGYRLERRFFAPDGRPVDLARLRQNQQLVVLLEGAAEEPGYRRTLLVDPLPAGLELEPVRLVGATELERFAWLGQLDEPTYLALRDDRFVAALDLAPDRSAFRLAYLVRAVTPGSFELPGAQVEDMYDPARFARTASARIAITAR